MAEFIHLHVASGFSLRYGAAFPEHIAKRAAELGMPAVALTDRESLSGAVRFVQACTEQGVHPILGVELSLRQTGIVSATPMFGGAIADTRPERITVLARGAAGMVGINRLTSAHHAEGVSRDVVARVVEIVSDIATADEGLTVLLGPNSDVGRAVAQRQYQRAHDLLRSWRSTGAEIVCEVVSHRSRDAAVPATDFGIPLSTVGAARMWQFAESQHAPTVLTNAVRFVDSRQARVTDVLDATRRLVPLSAKNVDRTNGEGFFKSAEEMHALALEIAHVGGFDNAHADHLVAMTNHYGRRAIIDPQLDLGIGSIHVPELDVILHPSRRILIPATWDRAASPRRTAAVIAQEAAQADVVLRQRCESALNARGWDSSARSGEMRRRLDEECAVIQRLGFAAYFLTVAEVVSLTRELGVRVAARGSGAGSFVNHLLGISVLNPMDYDLIMERFLSPLRSSLPDIDIDVESHRRLDVYAAIFERFGADRVACVSMMDTYRVRHAIRDVGNALGLPRGEVDAFAKAFPHIRARDARHALQELPELRRSGFGALARTGQLDEFLDLVEGLDGLPRNIALHPCGVLLSDSSLLDRTPVQGSGADFPMSHYDKDDVETLGFLKLDVLGIRMQSAMSFALTEIERTEGKNVDLDAVPFDDAATFELIKSTKTLGCFQIESPGQRELVGKFAPETFDDIIIDISLFRPGPVKSDMVTPFLNARQGWKPPEFLHPQLKPILQSTFGVVVFHEQVIKIVAEMTGCSFAEADEVRRGLGSWEQHDVLRGWFYPEALKRDFDLDVVDRVWDVLRAFASFGFCKAHAGAFAVPTYQSAWLKAHHPAAFYAGVLTHDPGMYPKRLILEDARQMGVPVLGLDINRSQAEFVVEPVEDVLGIRIGLSQLKGISENEVHSIVEAAPFIDINDVWNRASVSRPTMERLVLAGALDELHHISSATRQRKHGTSRRDLLVHVAELDRWRSGGGAREAMLFEAGPGLVPLATGLPEMDAAERVQAELELLGMEVSHHVMDFHESVLAALGVTRARDLLSTRSRQEVLIAGVKVATQTPPVRSGKRVIFLTLDDATGPLDAAFFEDAQGPFAHTLFHSWTLLVRGVIRRTGPRGISIRATGCWDLQTVQSIFDQASHTPSGFDSLAGQNAVWEFMESTVDSEDFDDAGVEEAAASRSSRPVMTRRRAGGMGGGQRVLVHPSGFRQSPWADIAPAGGITPPAKLWHTSPGTPG